MTDAGKMKIGIRAQNFSSAEFKDWLASLKSRIRQSQLKAAVKINCELLRLYWSLGKDIIEKKMDSGYGSRFYENLSKELRAEFPDMEGFSETNLRYCKLFYQFYSRKMAIHPRLEDDSDVLPNGKTQENIVSVTIHPQVEDESDANAIWGIPWGHHKVLIAKCHSIAEALFYVRQTIENGWSRAVLMNFIEAGLYEARGKSRNNFTRLLPEPQSDLATETLKDPYNFDFITLSERYRERELENALTENIVKFLLELGRGFTFYGRQIPLKAGDEDLFADMVFYHLELRCFVIIELKARPFEAAFAGQLGVYVAAANHQLKRADDNPSIGLLICKTKNNVLAQYALESSSQPIGISEYKLARLLPKKLKSALPAISEIESELSVTNDPVQKNPRPAGKKNNIKGSSSN